MKAAASAQTEENSRAGPQRTEKQKEAKESKQKDVREKSTTDRKELLIQRPKLDALVCIARQAVENLWARKEISIHDPSLKTPQKYRQTSEQRIRQQRPISAKGQSAVVGKGKAEAPKATLPTETITT